VVNTGSAEAHRIDSCLAVSGTLFLISPGWHNISNLHPSY
jgi:hypothetical protein